MKVTVTGKGIADPPAWPDALPTSRRVAPAIPTGPVKATVNEVAFGLVAFGVGQIKFALRLLGVAPIGAKRRPTLVVLPAATVVAPTGAVTLKSVALVPLIVH